jgi:uncharacterized protein (DUF111 family)
MVDVREDANPLPISSFPKPPDRDYCKMCNFGQLNLKENRPGTLLTVIASPSARERLTAIVFRETTTIGVRYREMRRECLDRETVSVTTPFGDVRIKVARRDGEVLNASPEFDDCVRLAEQARVSVKEIQAVATKAWLDWRTP